MDVFLSVQVLFLRFLPKKYNVSSKALTSTERQYQQPQRKSQSIQFACLSSDPEISICGTPEAAIEIPETGRKFQNEATISGIAELNLCATNEMPSTEENVNNSPAQFRLIEGKCAALEKKVSDLEAPVC